MGGKHQAHGGRAGGQLLLPFWNLDVRAGAADDRDHQWRAREPLALECNLLGCGAGVIGGKGGGDRFAGGISRVAFEHDEAPGRELAVIGDARRDR